MNKHYQIGVTGGIGSGKSTVCKIFSILNIPVYDADTRAKQLMNENHELISQITNLFGKEAYDDSGQLNRKFIAKSVFEDKKALARLNSLVHPSVAEDYLKWREDQSSELVIEEAALLFEGGIDKRLDFIVVVAAPDELRISRVIQRDKRTEEQIRAIMANQWEQEKKIKLADFVIRNDNTTPVIPQVLQALQIIKEKANLK